MSFFPDHLIEKWEARIEIEEEFVFEAYFNKLTNSQSNFNFFEFLAEDYDHASDNALNCLEYGFDMEKIPIRKARDWIMSSTECIYTLLGQYLERKGKTFKEYDKYLEDRIPRLLSHFGSGWESVIEKLETIKHSSRNPVAHTPEGRQLKKSRAIRKKALNHKAEFIFVHMESLLNIKKDKGFQNYEREKEV